ncbi:hypothetical protein THOM_3234 [Trachipleistophora hominis]|uniref:Uncharacterized protein n=1 Tax=Trachipleistophora hominis TaxID=72359 RepID=L7JQZ3_TRAHO|nr:hypothetical protein THOM_3234 [Trachipleistophora hominis]
MRCMQVNSTCYVLFIFKLIHAASGGGSGTQGSLAEELCTVIQDYGESTSNGTSIMYHRMDFTIAQGDQATGLHIFEPALPLSEIVSYAVHEQQMSANNPRQMKKVDALLDAVRAMNCAAKVVVNAYFLMRQGGARGTQGQVISDIMAARQQAFYDGTLRQGAAADVSGSGAFSRAPGADARSPDQARFDAMMAEYSKDREALQDVIRKGEEREKQMSKDIDELLSQCNEAKKQKEALTEELRVLNESLAPQVIISPYLRQLLACRSTGKDVLAPEEAVRAVESMDITQVIDCLIAVSEDLLQERDGAMDKLVKVLEETTSISEDFQGVIDSHSSESKVIRDVSRRLNTVRERVTCALDEYSGAPIKPAREMRPAVLPGQPGLRILRYVPGKVSDRGVLAPEAPDASLRGPAAPGTTVQLGPGPQQGPSDFFSAFLDCYSGMTESLRELDNELDEAVRVHESLLKAKTPKLVVRGAALMTSALKRYNKTVQNQQAARKMIDSAKSVVPCSDPVLHSIAITLEDNEDILAALTQKLLHLNNVYAQVYGQSFFLPESEAKGAESTPAGAVASTSSIPTSTPGARLQARVTQRYAAPVEKKSGDQEQKTARKTPQISKHVPMSQLGTALGSIWQSAFGQVSSAPAVSSTSASASQRASGTIAAPRIILPSSRAPGSVTSPTYGTAIRLRSFMPSQ